MKVRRALLSVSDKTGIVELGAGLVSQGVTLVSTGGTAAALAGAGVAVTQVSEVTGAPEILDGRVKTLHPRIHAGILADRRKERHREQLRAHGIETIDLVVCNLYPFERTAADPRASEDDVIEQIDIGGPALVRAAAKNFRSVAVVVDPSRYADIVRAIAATGGISEELRRELARAAFEHTVAYDAAIVGYLANGRFPQHLVVSGYKMSDLRYGENPHQRAALYQRGRADGIATARRLGGKELSYNNLLDADAAWGLVRELDAPAAAIVKHSNPCGVAVADRLSVAHARALDCDPLSAFGGIVALSRRCDRTTAEQITSLFTEVVVAPGFDHDALEVLRAKHNLRILQPGTAVADDVECRTISGGLLVQSADPRDAADEARVVTRIQPTTEQWGDLRFAWLVAKHVRSNGVVLADAGVAVGIGAGQPSRVEAMELAARRAGERAMGTVCASDAFLPFRDGLDAAVAAGAVAVIQPGGSVRDAEVVAAADEHGVPMVFTGRRHFRH